jgi:hypothetical protein
VNSKEFVQEALERGGGMVTGDGTGPDGTPGALVGPLNRKSI